MGLSAFRKRLCIDFFTGGRVQYWKMSANQDVIASGERVYVLAEEGPQYVVYAAMGGSLSLDLPDGQDWVMFFEKMG